MSGKSPLAASAEQRDALKRLAVSVNRAEADRARAILLSLSGWKSAAIGEVFGVREDTVRDWRSSFMREGLAGIERHPAPGCSPVKAEAALAVASELFAAPVENRINWTLPRLSEEIERRTGHRISHSRLSVVLRKKGALPASDPATR
ncbi:MAG: helix-turn-helix domain-containing protein [Gammaproteobacteria bacterium]|uniref:helix-turn-helix domain-containing protein n=1 Tax=Paraburkholderia sp. TaxID=1926495 RepID=UPI003D6F859B